jgi:sugar lactone lactonase YvrE
MAAGEVEVVVDYDPPYLPEGIAVDKSGNIFVSMANQSEIRKITPDGAESVLATLPVGGFGLLAWRWMRRAMSMRVWRRPMG